MIESFTDDQVKDAIKAFLELGEQTYEPEQESVGRGAKKTKPNPGNLRHMGYFATCGWAARCLRWYYEQLMANKKQLVTTLAQQQLADEIKTEAIKLSNKRWNLKNSALAKLTDEEKEALEIR